jgi:ABC-type transport system involved in multi-copper enzyme maturation permease subunit
MEVNFTDLGPFFSWFPGALLHWGIAVVTVFALIVAVGWIVSAIGHGPVAAFSRCYNTLRYGLSDFVFLSPRRVRTLAWLAVKESMRRWILIVAAIFGLIILFAGWFLDPGSANPAYLYLNFVLTWTGFLMLILAWLLSAMSLPADFSNHTIQTLVTKPVRTSEIILGRILGFAAVTTALLALMGVVSFFFVTRGLAHTHQLPAPETMQRVTGTPVESPTLTGHTTTVQKHFHIVYREPTGQYRVEMNHGHTHPVLEEEKEGAQIFSLGGAEGWLEARVPVYGTLCFLDRVGRLTKRGISVGWESDYKSFIMGGSSAAAVWDFEGVTPERFPEGIRIEMDLSVFRSFKGDVEKSIPGSLVLRKPQADPSRKGGVFKEYIFDALEYRPTEVFIPDPRKIEGPDGKTLDLFRDLTEDGKLEIQLRCEEPSQCFGVAQNNLYLRARDNPFWLNFVKAYVGIWMQIVLLITLGVFFSTFLSAPIALGSTLGVAAVGRFFHTFLSDLAAGKTYGGGPFESIYRILAQENQTSELPHNLLVSVLTALDVPAKEVMKVLAHVLPDFGRFDFSSYVANGFDIPLPMLAQYGCRLLAFALPVFVAAYFCLRGREAAK